MSGWSDSTTSPRPISASCCRSTSGNGPGATPSRGTVATSRPPAASCASFSGAISAETRPPCASASAPGASPSCREAKGRASISPTRAGWLYWLSRATAIWGSTSSVSARCRMRRTSRGATSRRASRGRSCVSRARNEGARSSDAGRERRPSSRPPATVSRDRSTPSTSRWRRVSRPACCASRGSPTPPAASGSRTCRRPRGSPGRWRSRGVRRGSCAGAGTSRWR